VSKTKDIFVYTKGLIEGIENHVPYDEVEVGEAASSGVNIH